MSLRFPLVESGSASQIWFYYHLKYSYLIQMIMRHYQMHKCATGKSPSCCDYHNGVYLQQNICNSETRDKLSFEEISWISACDGVAVMKCNVGWETWCSHSWFFQVNVMYARVVPTGPWPRGWYNTWYVMTPSVIPRSVDYLLSSSRNNGDSAKWACHYQYGSSSYCFLPLQFLFFFWTIWWWRMVLNYSICPTQNCTYMKGTLPNCT